MSTQKRDRGYLILHGWAGSGAEHWQTWLAERLSSAGEFVRYPVLPDYDAPDLAQWLSVLRQELSAMDGIAERVVICHSLSVVLWLHHAKTQSRTQAERLLLVAPPCPQGCLPEFASFFPVPLDKIALMRSARDIRLVCTAGDPYCPEQAAIYYGQSLGIETEILPPQAGHINVESGYGPWPAVEGWCRR